jgi:hypothetical protein
MSGALDLEQLVVRRYKSQNRLYSTIVLIADFITFNGRHELHS